MRDSDQAKKPDLCFRVYTDGQQLHESDALPFDTLEAAWQEGAMTACELIRGMYGQIHGDLDWKLEISDTSGKAIYRFTFKAENLTLAHAGDGPVVTKPVI